MSASGATPMAVGAPFLTPTGLATTRVFPRCGGVDKLLCSLILTLGSQLGRGSGPSRTWCTVGRAERYAIREGLDAVPDHQCFVTDLLALAQEGE
eukprot:6224962-Pyramimonas_sp.AAC.1